MCSTFECPSCSHVFTSGYWTHGRDPGLDPCDHCITREWLKTKGRKQPKRDPATAMAKIEQVKEALAESPLWHHEIPGAYGFADTWLWFTNLETPEWAQKSQWKQATYIRRIYIVIIGRKAIIRLDSCPWIATRDLDTTNKHALEVIKDPEGEFR